MALNNTRLITPRQEEDIYPYHKVWVNIFIQITLLSVMTIVLFALVNFLGVSFETELQTQGILVLAFSPALLWLIFSFLPEKSVQQPRTELMQVFILTVLVANAIGMPLIGYLNLTEWLAKSSTLERIIGYTVTYGVLQEFLKYLVLRYSVWKDYRIASDSVAYAFTTAIAYATVVNLYFVSQNPTATLDTTSSRVLLHVTANLAASLILSYGLSQLRFAKVNVILLPATFLLSIFVVGVSIAMRTTFHNAPIAIIGAFTRPLFSLAFTIAVLYTIFFVVLFLYTVDDETS